MEKVFKARKNNRVLRIPESRIKEYSELGYTIKDGEGNIIFEPENKAKKIADLEAENADLKAKLDEAEKYAEGADKKISDLEAENADLKAKLKEAEKYAEGADKKISDLEAEIDRLKEDKKPAAKKSSKAKASDDDGKGQEAE